MQLLLNKTIHSCQNHSLTYIITTIKMANTSLCINVELISVKFSVRGYDAR